jgi:uncharacterized protein YndB with AHSA1/START domain
MTQAATLDDYGVLTAPLSLRIERVLPGPIERVWAYLTQEDLRRQWMAYGQMEQREGAEFELVWRNNELTNPPGARPDGYPDEHRMKSTILEIDPPRKLRFTWMQGEVTFELRPSGDKVVLTVDHKRISDRKNLLSVSAGWHAHLDLLAARIAGKAPAQPHWDHWANLHKEYEQRIPA